MENRLIKALEVLLANSVAILVFSTIGPLLADEPVVEPVAAEKAWKFRVYLDEKEIGYHHFYLVELGETKQLKTVASFEYKLLFIRLFQYEHQNREIWSGDCLESIHSVTDNNGQPLQVKGQRESGSFLVAASGGGKPLPECVMSFAYWNPSFLDQTYLLNSQSGEYQEVEISEPVFEELEVRGELHPSSRYRLSAGALNLDLWYSINGEWLALESEVEGGRKLRYELEEGPGFSASTAALRKTASINGVVSGPGGTGLS